MSRLLSLKMFVVAGPCGTCGVGAASKPPPPKISAIGFAAAGWGWDYTGAEFPKISAIGFGWAAAAMG